MVSAARRRVVYRALKNIISDNIYKDELGYWIVKVSDQHGMEVLSDEQAEELYALAESKMPKDEDEPECEAEEAPTSEVAEVTEDQPAETPTDGDA